jgi:hypothetical protein
MKSLGSIIDELRSGGPGSDGSLMAGIAAAWKAAAGEGLASLTEPRKVAAGILTVHADHPGAIFELRIREAEILTHLNDSLGRRVLRRIAVSGR